MREGEVGSEFWNGMEWLQWNFGNRLNKMKTWNRISRKTRITKTKYNISDWFLFAGEMRSSRAANYTFISISICFILHFSTEIYPFAGDNSILYLSVDSQKVCLTFKMIYSWNHECQPHQFFSIVWRIRFWKIEDEAFRVSSSHGGFTRVIMLNSEVSV
jgi:hypothetical protein